MMDGPAIAILAAGGGKRFGGDKLDAPVAGRPLGRHALGSALALDAGRLAIVVGDNAPAFARSAADEGLAELIANPSADEGLASSVALAAQWAGDAGSDALLLLLADMPLVSSETLRRLVEAVSPGCPAAARHADDKAGIPACFPSDYFDALQALQGDRGAAALLRQAERTSIIDVPARELADIDTPADLERLATLMPGER